MHGGVAKDALKTENLTALRAGFANLRRHTDNLAKFGLPIVVSVNRFGGDSKAELDLLIALCAEAGVEAVVAEHWAHGGAGAADLGKAVLNAIEKKPATFKTLYPDSMPLLDKIRTIAQQLYRADDIAPESRVVERLAEFEKAGFGHLPICMAKTQYSFSADPDLKGAPTGFALPIREVRLSAGAGFVVALCGDVMTMPGLPKRACGNEYRCHRRRTHHGPLLMEDIAEWRRATRAELVARRVAIEPNQRRLWGDAIAKTLPTALETLSVGTLGFYWPFKGEFDPRPAVIDLLARGWRAALPVVTAKNHPLTYLAWTPDTRMERGVLGIMIPSYGAPITPTAVLAPLVGFDAARYRLGNGGGYFDRTLALLQPKPFSIGIGYAFGRLPTIYPQPHDLPMDAIITEEGIAR